MPTAASAPIVAIIAQGEMGHGVAQRLAENGVRVLTSLAGRSPRSEARAGKAGKLPAAAKAAVDVRNSRLRMAHLPARSGATSVRP